MIRCVSFHPTPPTTDRCYRKNLNWLVCINQHDLNQQSLTSWTDVNSWFPMFFVHRSRCFVFLCEKSFNSTKFIMYSLCKCYSKLIKTSGSLITISPKEWFEKSILFLYYIIMITLFLLHEALQMFCFRVLL